MRQPVFEIAMPGKILPSDWDFRNYLTESNGFHYRIPAQDSKANMHLHLRTLFSLRKAQAFQTTLLMLVGGQARIGSADSPCTSIRA